MISKCDVNLSRQKNRHLLSKNFIKKMPGAKRSKRTNPSENPSDSSKKSKTTSQSEASNPENKIGAGGAAPKPSSKYTTEPDFSNQRAIQNLVSTQNYDIKSGEIPTDYYWSVSEDHKINWDYLEKPTPTHMLLKVCALMAVKSPAIKVDQQPDPYGRYSVTANFLNYKVEISHEAGITDRKLARTIASDLLLLKIYGEENHQVEIYTQNLVEDEHYIYSTDEEYFEESKNDEKFKEHNENQKLKKIAEFEKSDEVRFKKLTNAEIIERKEEIIASFIPTYDLSAIPDYLTILETFKYMYYLLALENTKAIGLDLIYELHLEEQKENITVHDKRESVEFKPPVNRQFDLRPAMKNESLGEDILYDFIEKCKTVTLKCLISGKNDSLVHIAFSKSLTDEDCTQLGVIENLDKLTKMAIQEMVDKNFVKRLIKPLESHRGATSKKGKNAKGQTFNRTVVRLPAASDEELAKRKATKEWRDKRNAELREGNSGWSSQSNMQGMGMMPGMNMGGGMGNMGMMNMGGMNAGGMNMSGMNMGNMNGMNMGGMNMNNANANMMNTMMTNMMSTMNKMNNMMSGNMMNPTMMQMMQNNIGLGLGWICTLVQLINFVFDPVDKYSHGYFCISGELTRKKLSSCQVGLLFES